METELEAELEATREYITRLRRIADELEETLDALTAGLASRPSGVPLER